MPGLETVSGIILKNQKVKKQNQWINLKFEGVTF